MDRKRRQYVSAFLRALGIAETDEEILALFDGAESIRNTWSGTRSPTRTRRCSTSTASSGQRADNGRVGTEPHADSVPQPEAVRPHRVGRYKLDQKFGRPEDSEHRSAGRGLLSDDDILDTIRYLVHLHAGTPTFTPPTGPRYRCKPTTSTTSATAGCAPSAS